MGCFLDCFGSSSKDRKRIHQRKKNKILPRDQRHVSHKPLQSSLSPEKDTSAKPVNPISEATDDEVEEQLSLSIRRKVTFDANVKAYEPVSVCESSELLPEINRNDEKQKEESSGKSSTSHFPSEDDSIPSTVEFYPLNHRYQNCRDSDDEEEELEGEDSDRDNEGGDDMGKKDSGYYNEDADDDEDDDGRILGQEVWSRSFPTASMELSTKTPSARVLMEEEDGKTVGSNRNARDRSVYVHHVLNPVENLTQLKVVKSKRTRFLKPMTENFTSDQPEPPRVSFTSEPTFEQSSFSFKSKSNQVQEMAVNASLSNWLVSSEPTKKSSSIGIETISAERIMSQGSNSVMG